MPARKRVDSTISSGTQSHAPPRGPGEAFCTAAIAVLAASEACSTVAARSTSRNANALPRTASRTVLHTPGAEVSGTRHTRLNAFWSSEKTPLAPKSSVPAPTMTVPMPPRRPVPLHAREGIVEERRQRRRLGHVERRDDLRAGGGVVAEEEAEARDREEREREEREEGVVRERGGEAIAPVVRPPARGLGEETRGGPPRHGDVPRQQPCPRPCAPRPAVPGLPSRLDRRVSPHAARRGGYGPTSASSRLRGLAQVEEHALRHRHHRHGQEGADGLEEVLPDEQRENDEHGVDLGAVPHDLRDQDVRLDLDVRR